MKTWARRRINMNERETKKIAAVTIKLPVFGDVTP
jgi:hypothetical protein